MKKTNNFLIFSYRLFSIIIFCQNTPMFLSLTKRFQCLTSYVPVVDHMNKNTDYLENVMFIAAQIVFIFNN